jgi:hypothetical protein
MDDKKFDDLKIRMTILPEAHKWPPPDYTHWERLHAVADEVRSRVAKAFAALDEIDHNPDLSPEGRIKGRAKLAEQAITNFQRSKTLEEARAAVERQQTYWAKKIEEVIKPATDHCAAAMYAQIRDRVSSIEAKSRLSFIDKHIDDPAVVSAVLSAPEFLSGLSAVEIGVVKQKLAKRVLSPEIFEAKDLTEKALLAAEKGWARAVDVIAQRGGLQSSKAKAA